MGRYNTRETIRDVYKRQVCGDDCAKWILSIGKSKDLTINLRHIMDFGEMCIRDRVWGNVIPIKIPNPGIRPFS